MALFLISKKAIHSIIIKQYQLYSNERKNLLLAAAEPVEEMYRATVGAHRVWVTRLIRNDLVYIHQWKYVHLKFLLQITSIRCAYVERIHPSSH